MYHLFGFSLSLCFLVAMRWADFFCHFLQSWCFCLRASRTYTESIWRLEAKKQMNKTQNCWPLSYVCQVHFPPVTKPQPEHSYRSPLSRKQWTWIWNLTCALCMCFSLKVFIQPLLFSSCILALPGHSEFPTWCFCDETLNRSGCLAIHIGLIWCVKNNHV